MRGISGRVQVGLTSQDQSYCNKTDTFIYRRINHASYSMVCNGFGDGGGIGVDGAESFGAGWDAVRGTQARQHSASARKHSAGPGEHAAAADEQSRDGAAAGCAESADDTGWPAARESATG